MVPSPSRTILKVDYLQGVQFWGAVLSLRWPTFSNLPRLNLVPKYFREVTEQGSTAAVVISIYFRSQAPLKYHKSRGGRVRGVAWNLDTLEER